MVLGATSDALIADYVLRHFTQGDEDPTASIPRHRRQDEAVASGQWSILGAVGVLHALATAQGGLSMPFGVFSCATVPTPDLTSRVDQVALLAVRELAVEPQVRSIYVHRYRGEIQFTVLLAIDRYDDALMDRLLAAEYGIQRTLPDLAVSFSYPPVGTVPRKSEMVPSGSRCVYAR